jgi:hypothetical protein
VIRAALPVWAMLILLAPPQIVEIRRRLPWPQELCRIGTDQGFVSSQGGALVWQPLSDGSYGCTGTSRQTAIRGVRPRATYLFTVTGRAAAVEALGIGVAWTQQDGIPDTTSFLLPALEAVFTRTGRTLPPEIRLCVAARCEDSRFSQLGPMSLILDRSTPPTLLYQITVAVADAPLR